VRLARNGVLIYNGFGAQFPELRDGGANILEKLFLPSELVRKVEDILNQGRQLRVPEDKPFFLRLQQVQFMWLGPGRPKSSAPFPTVQEDRP